ncbi:MAG: heavy metal translocating P-type ATPase [Anaerovoracaceae bacterium]|jgi:Cd2+/Zn2+-exporting ATPase
MKPYKISLNQNSCCSSCDLKHSNAHHHGSISRREILRLGIGAFLLAVILISGMGHRMDQEPGFQYIASLSLSIFTLLWTGGPVFLQALKNIAGGRIFDEFFLMSLATAGALAIGDASEGIAVMLFYQVGELMQERAVASSKKSISALMNIRPDYANVLKEGKLVTVKPEDVEIGQLFQVAPGERIPIDGIITKGDSVLDTSSLTGESLPQNVGKGDMVLSGSINQGSLLTIKSTKRFEHSTVSRILDLVENAASKKAPMENFITRFARYYTPVVVGLALVIAILPPLLTASPFRDWIHRGLIFLVISCPCALVISIPLSFFAGIGLASRHGILVKGGNYMEALSNVDTVAFDKTGTLTKGIFKVSKVLLADRSNLSKERFIEYAALAEAHSNHPIAKSIISCHPGETDPARITEHSVLPGLGVVAIIDGHRVLAGNQKLMEKKNISVPSINNDDTKVFVSIDGLYAGCFIIADEIKEDSKDTIIQLKRMGVRRIVMLTGDTESASSAIAASLDLDQYHSNLLPDEKVYQLENLHKSIPSKGRLIFMGDGINDAPVLARADVGIAMGGLGADVAIEAADIVIMTDEPSKLVTALKISRNTRKIVYQNIVFALTVKVLLLLLGALGLANMWEAVFADVGVTILAILNSLRQLKRPITGENLPRHHS